MNVTIGVPYSRAQLEELVDSETASQLQQRGLVLQFDVLSETYQVVPPSTASMNFSGAARTGSASFDAPDPIQKRTPLERVASLTKRWIDDCRAAGTVPGLDDEKLTEILGEAWRSGHSEVTSEMVTDVARYFLQQAENQHEEKLSKQITRHED